ncbi:MAG: LppX_LprAFG lipoprotein [Actinomycetota bacterium]
MRARLIVVVAVMAVVGGACGGSSGAGSADLAKLVSDATSKTRESSARLAMDVTATSPQFPNPVHITASGAFENSDQRGLMKMRIPDLTGSGQAPKQLEIRVIGTKVYAMVPGLGSSDKPWIETDASTFGAQSGSFGSSDPSQFLDYLKGASNNIRDEGDDTVRGVHTRKLGVQLDLRKAVASLGEQQRQAVEQAIQQLGTSSIPAEVWIDGQGRLRKMEFSLHLQKGGQQADISLSLEMFDFGVQVNVQPPPRSQVSQSGLGGL